MENNNLFQWVILKQDVLDSSVQRGDRGVIVDHLLANKNQPEPGYIVEVFKDGETLDVVSVPTSWVILLDQKWGESNHTETEARAS